MSVITADGSIYFDFTGIPIMVGRSFSSAVKKNDPLIAHDLTEIEHCHDFSELFIVKRGQGMQCLEGTSHPITAGDVFLLQGQQRHYFHDRKGLELINVMFNPDQLGFPENELRRMPGYSALFLLEPNYRHQHRFASHLHLKHRELNEAEDILIAMEHECQTKEPGYEVNLRAKLLELIVYLSRQYLKVETTESQALLRVGKVIGAMENNLSANWTIEKLTEIAHMSKSNLLTVFRKATGETPIEYLINLRIHKSIQLLKNTNLSITAIAYKIGFNDSNYFTRQFRKTIGSSPRTFRNKNT
ncbi:AraC family transcriptional regulator [Puniceicoccaceae bacterium K14]|nr:AraC family transcriptional regulator [Puniceicoccaceae bacterium K14]